MHNKFTSLWIYWIVRFFFFMGKFRLKYDVTWVASYLNCLCVLRSDEFTLTILIRLNRWNEVIIESIAINTDGDRYFSYCYSHSMTATDYQSIWVVHSRFSLEYVIKFQSFECCETFGFIHSNDWKNLRMKNNNVEFTNCHGIICNVCKCANIHMTQLNPTGNVFVFHILVPNEWILCGIACLASINVEFQYIYIYEKIDIHIQRIIRLH